MMSSFHCIFFHNKLKGLIDRHKIAAMSKNENEAKYLLDRFM